MSRNAMHPELKLTPHMREYLSAAAISFRLDPAGAAIISVHAPGPRAEVLGGIAAAKATWDSGLYPAGDDPCRAAIGALDRLEEFGSVEPWAVYRVGFTKQGQHLRSTGVGTALYRALLMALAFHPRHSSRHGVLLVPDKCGAGNPTSDEAARVWLKLSREVPSKLWTDNTGRELPVLFLPVATAYSYAQAAGLLDEKGMTCPEAIGSQLGGLSTKPWMVPHLCIHDRGVKLQPWAPALAYMAPFSASGRKASNKKKKGKKSRRKKNPMTAQQRKDLGSALAADAARSQHEYARPRRAAEHTAEWVLDNAVSWYAPHGGLYHPGKPHLEALFEWTAGGIGDYPSIAQIDDDDVREYLKQFLAGSFELPVVSPRPESARRKSVFRAFKNPALRLKRSLL